MDILKGLVDVARLRVGGSLARLIFAIDCVRWIVQSSFRSGQNNRKPGGRRIKIGARAIIRPNRSYRQEFRSPDSGVTSALSRQAGWPELEPGWRRIADHRPLLRLDPLDCLGGPPQPVVAFRRGRPASHPIITWLCLAD
jgi:hypothetical protein